MHGKLFSTSRWKLSEEVRRRKAKPGEQYTPSLHLYLITRRIVSSAILTVISEYWLPSQAPAAGNAGRPSRFVDIGAIISPTPFPQALLLPHPLPIPLSTQSFSQAKTSVSS